MGAPDPRLTISGKLDFRLYRQFRGYQREDPPPERVKPIPVRVLHECMRIADAHASAKYEAIADIIAEGFFFLFRPGEATGVVYDHTTFTLADITLFVHQRRIPALYATDADLTNATFVLFCWRDQKNGNRNEVIGQGRSGDHRLCPVLAACRRLRHLKAHNAEASTPFCTYFHVHCPHRVTSADMTQLLRQAVRTLGPQTLGFTEQEVSARSLRAAGAMALMCAGVNDTTIGILGRWQSNSLFRYLTPQAEPIMRDFARRMLAGGDYRLLPGPQVPHPFHPP